MARVTQQIHSDSAVSYAVDADEVEAFRHGEGCMSQLPQALPLSQLDAPPPLTAPYALSESVSSKVPFTGIGLSTAGADVGPLEIAFAGVFLV